uniref:DNA helicase n=1 Tax=Cyprinus carpio carpio TaxID=630221 RepID=A0A9J8BM68_CYPCA
MEIYWKLIHSMVFPNSSHLKTKHSSLIFFFISQDEIERKGSILVDYKDLLSNKLISHTLPNLAKDLKEMPEKILDCLGVAIHQVLTVDLERRAAELLPAGLRPIIIIPHIRARVYNYEPLIPRKSLRANLYGKFVAIRGTAVRVSNIKPFCSKLALVCNSCLMGNTPYPLRYSMLPCLQTECRGHAVQELMSGDQRESGRIPRTIECELTQDLVDSCVPGDKVTITGVIKVSNKEGNGRNKKDKCMFLLYIQVNSLRAASDSEGQGPSVKFSIKDLYAIQEIQAQEDLFRLIVNSLRPAIYGHLVSVQILCSYCCLCPSGMGNHDHLLSEHVKALCAGKNGAVSSAAVTRYSTQESIPLKTLYHNTYPKYSTPNTEHFVINHLPPFKIVISLSLQARAHVELREKCSCVSVFSLADTYSDEFGRLDFDLKKFVTVLNRLAEHTNKNTSEFQELRQLARDLQIQHYACLRKCFSIFMLLTVYCFHVHK